MNIYFWTLVIVVGMVLLVGFEAYTSLNIVVRRHY